MFVSIAGPDDGEFIENVGLSYLTYRDDLISLYYYITNLGEV